MFGKGTLYGAAFYVLLMEIVCLGADYYVDASAGNDANAGTSTSTAWRSVAKVNSRTFAPGDRILFRRGQVWREQLIIPSSGISGKPITYGAYGTGNRPCFKGSALVSGWTSHSSTVWRGSLGAAPNQVFFDGVRGTKESGTASLDRAMEWYWSGGVLYVYATSNPGSSVEASVRPSTRSYGLLHVVGREYVNIESIEVTQSASFGLYIKAPSRYVTVRDCDVSHSLDGGLVAPSSSGVGPTQLTVEDCLVHYNNGGFKEGAPGTATYHEGLTMENVDGFVIRRTKVFRNYMEGSNFKRGARNGLIEYCDLYANDLINQYIEGATNIEIRYNRIYDCSYNAGIEFGMETNTFHNDNVRIHHNLFWNNSGGVSFWAGSFTGQHRNIKIENNTFFANWEAIRWKSGATDNYSGTNYIRNNILWQNSTSNRAIWDYTSGQQAISRTIISHNAFMQGAPTHTTGSYARAVTDPYFVNASSRDFHLRSGSSCIDAGAGVDCTIDLAGVSIPQGEAPDIGAYEYGSAAPTPTSYTLSVSAAHGTVARTPDQSSYSAGQTVTLQATPNSGYTFSGWSGALSGTANPASLVMDSSKSVTADFVADMPVSYTLAISATNGVVNVTPSKAGYTAGETVTLQATPNTGYTFAGWSGALSGSANPATLVMDSNKSVTADFTANTYMLIVDAENGTVTRTPDKASYAHGETVMLQAVADAGYRFAGWSGDASGTDDSVVVVMDGDRTVMASFASLNSDGQPPVLRNCVPAPDSIQAPRNTLVTLHLCDEGRGVDGASVVIRVNGSIVYAGDVACYSSAYGVCHRSGTRADYTYTYQQSRPFRHSTQVFVAVNARDLAGNVMPEQVYSFDTEMHSFGGNRSVCGDQTNLAQGRPATVGDGQGNLWVVWHAGNPGGRHVYATCVRPGADAYGVTVQLSQSTGDHCNPALALDGAGTLYAVWQENAGGPWDVWMSTSADGATWSGPRRVGGAPDGQVDATVNRVHPSVAAGGPTNAPVAVAWQEDRAGQQDIFIAVSTDRFATSTVAQVTSGSRDQIDPAVAVGDQGTVYVLWTEVGSGASDIYGAASDSGPWTNRPIVSTGARQSHAAVAVGSDGVLHIAWVDDSGDNSDIYYGASEGLPTSPLTGTGIIDDTSGANQQSPAIAVAKGIDGADRVFVCWEDERNVAYSGDTDLYFAEVGAGLLGTNVLVDDEGTSGNLAEPAVGVDGEGYPYVVWAGNASATVRLFWAGVTYADPDPLARATITAASGGTVGTPPESVATLEDVSVVVPPAACPIDATVSIARIYNPQGYASESLRHYEFGPSGLTFFEPVTITIPYPTGTSGKFRAYWFDSTTGLFTDEGVSDVQDISLGKGRKALQFRTTHFTPYYLMSVEEAAGASGGGCSLVVGQEGDAIEYFVPYLVLALVMVVLRCRDRRRRLAPPGRS